jgi:CubicO group peptidase (beta-lactamase class C family)
MTRLIAAALLAACHLFAGVALAQGPDAALAARVDAMFAQHNQAPGPGLALAVVRDGQVLLRRGYGLANIEHRVPITPSTVFDVASVSKQFTGLAVAMLVQQGRVRMSDDIRTHIPELPDLGRRITVAHLVHHTSGLRDWPGTLAVGGWRFDDVISFDQILAMAYHQRDLNFAPGAEHMYSNTGYNLLAEMVQRVTGRPFRAWTHEQLFAPLGMTATHFRDDHTEVIADRAFGYARMDGGYRHSPNNLTALGSSSLFSSVDDLARWMINFDRATVGGRAAMDLMRTKGRLNDGTEISYAFGIVHGRHRGLPMLTHSGSWASFRTFLAWLPEQRFGVVVLANSGSIDVQNAVIRITDIYLERELAAAQASAPAPATPTAALVPPATPDEITGMYRLGTGWYVRIRRQGDAFTAQATHEEAVPMTQRSRSEFWVESYRASMLFPADAAGKVTRLEYRGIRAPKVEDVPRPAGRLDAYAGEYESAELGTAYRVAVRNGALEMHHRRHGTIPLAWIRGDEFGSTTWFMRSVSFQRDAAGTVTALVVNVDPRSRDIRFVKRR